MKQVIEFLKELSRNNNREWFQAHKAEYQAAQAKFNAFAEELIERVGEFDESVRGLTLRDCTYRIYRDLRFSKDKTPYKTHFGVYICPGGKKSGYSGYYFHVGTGEGEGYPGRHMLCAGDYRGDRKVLQVVREDIVDCGDEFRQIMDGLSDGLVLDEDYRLKRLPKGFSEDSVNADYLKYRVYCLIKYVDEGFVVGDGLVDRVAEAFRSAMPFLHFLNRAIEYVKEEGAGI